jgi:biopolymer transport protein ExbB
MSKLFWVLVVTVSLAAPGIVDAQQINGNDPTPTPVTPREPAGVQPAQTSHPSSSDSAKPGTAKAGAERDSIPTVILEMVKALSWFVVPFALATLIAIWFTTERLVVLRRGRVLPKPFVQRFLKLLEEGELDKEEALQICEENGSPIAQVFAHGIRKWGKASVEVEQAIIDGGERQVSALRKHLRVINGVATITPLIGLLGTVWGMLESFNRIAEAGAMGRTDELASGISLALVTTAVGLIIAIPCLVIHMYFAGRVDALVTEMDELSQKVVLNVSAEGLAERGARPRKIKDGGESPQKKAV